MEKFSSALEEAYAGVPDVIYILPDTDFIEGKTQFKGEVVAEKAIPVLEEIPVDNALELLEALEAQGTLQILRFPKTLPGLPQDKNDIVEKAVLWTGDFGDEYLDLVNQYHPDILETVIQRLKDMGYTPETEVWKNKFGK